VSVWFNAWDLFDFLLNFEKISINLQSTQYCGQYTNSKINMGLSVKVGTGQTITLVISNPELIAQILTITDLLYPSRFKDFLSLDL